MKKDFNFKLHKTNCFHMPFLGILISARFKPITFVDLFCSGLTVDASIPYQLIVRLGKLFNYILVHETLRFHNITLYSYLSPTI